MPPPPQSLGRDTLLLAQASPSGKKGTKRPTLNLDEKGVILGTSGSSAYLTAPGQTVGYAFLRLGLRINAAPLKILHQKMREFRRCGILS
jgi:hypothetical protein